MRRGWEEAWEREGCTGGEGDETKWEDRIIATKMIMSDEINDGDAGSQL